MAADVAAEPSVIRNCKDKIAPQRTLFYKFATVSEGWLVLIRSFYMTKLHSNVFIVCEKRHLFEIKKSYKFRFSLGRGLNPG